LKPEWQGYKQTEEKINEEKDEMMGEFYR